MDSATPEAVADYCGIDLDHAPADTVPLRYYQEHGDVRCEKCGRGADPPWLVVANYPAGRWCHECFADRLHIEALPEPQALAVALHLAGWEARKIDRSGLLPVLADDAHELLRAADRKLDRTLSRRQS